MKVAILSMQCVDNYGSYLQAYALKSILESCGHECSFIAPQKDRDIPELQRGSGVYLRKACERFLNWDIVQRLYYFLHFKRQFATFHRDFPVGSTAEHYDLVVIGSDEVFNSIQPAPWCFSSQLYGNLPNASKVATYAGSFGHTTYEDIRRCGVEDVIRESLSRVAELSVRDRNSYDLIKQLTGRDPQLNIDPVLVYDYHKQIPTSIPEKDYILIYSYPNRIKDPKEIAAIRQFAKSKGKMLISIGFYFPWCDKTVVPHPFEVLTYFRSADYVITDTFHGTVMSIKFNKQFGTLIRDTNRQKLTSLLRQFALEARSITIEAGASNLEQVMNTPSDYTESNNTLETEIRKAMSYLTTL